MSDVCGFYQRGADRHFSLAWEAVLGIRKAVLLNYIAFNVGENRRTQRKKFLIGDTYWWYHSLKQFYSAFPNWSDRQIQIFLKELREAGYIDTRQVAQNQAMWHTIVGEKIDELESTGSELLAKRSSEIWGEEGVEEVSTPDSNKFRLQAPKGVEETAVLEKYTTREKKEKNDAPVADAPVAASRPKKSLEDLQGAAAEKSLLKYRASFARTESVYAAERLWEAMVVEYHGRAALIPWGAGDRTNAKKHFIKWCVSGGTTLVEFLEYCIANWDTLRTHKLKALKITSPYPSFRTIYALKDRFLEEMKKNGGVQHKAKEVVISRVDQIPKDHPNFRVFKRIIEQGGTVSLS